MLRLWQTCGHGWMYELQYDLNTGKWYDGLNSCSGANHDQLACQAEEVRFPKVMGSVSCSVQGFSVKEYCGQICSLER